MPQIEISNADKREKYLWAGIQIIQSAYAITAAEGCDSEDELQEGIPKNVVYSLLHLLDVISKQTGLTTEGILQKRDAILRQHGESID